MLYLANGEFREDKVSTYTSAAVASHPNLDVKTNGPISVHVTNMENSERTQLASTPPSSTADTRKYDAITNHPIGVEDINRLCKQNNQSIFDRRNIIYQLIKLKFWTSIF